jgi:hypothetical protein
MNGATALPCVSTIKPPNTHIMISTGKSQYRLRTRMKRHNSNTIDIHLPHRSAVHTGLSASSDSYHTRRDELI